jgi:hypothetical protein
MDTALKDETKSDEKLLLAVLVLLVAARFQTQEQDLCLRIRLAKVPFADPRIR